MNMNAHIPQPLWERLRWARQGFFAGLLIGVVMGWFFHGIISFLVRFGLVLVLLLPLLMIGWLWWRSSRSAGPVRASTTVMTWRGDDPPGRGRVEDLTWTPERDADGTIPTHGRVADRPREPWRQRENPIPTDVEAELEALKREQESRH